MQNLLLALFIVLTLPLSAQERILSYDSDITLTTEGTMLVRETIRVVSEGDDIRRGIYRDLDNRSKYAYEVISATRDGADEPFKVEKKSGRLRVRLGSKEVLLEDGEHTYVIDYRATQPLLQLDDGTDEFSWQVTGTRWEFPIESASATLRLPGETAVSSYSCYTGDSGSQAHACTTAMPDDRTLTFTTTSPLDEEEGLTVAVAFERGLFASQPPPPPPAPWKREAGLYILVIGLFTYLYYAYETWSRHGVDPTPPRIGHQFTPPDDLSAASVGYLASQFRPVEAFTASLMALATKGYLRLEPEEKSGLLGSTSVTYHLRKTGKSAPAGSLPVEEELLYQRFFAGGDDVSLSATYDKQLEEIRKAHGKSLHEQHNDLIWSGSNWKYALPLIGIYFVTGVLSLIFAQWSDTPYFIAYTVIFMILGLLGIGLYFWLIAKPSPRKQKLLLEIKAFREYLGMSESKRRQIPSAPTMDAAHYEALLPYAIAFGINKKWSNYFGDLLSDDNYHPAYAMGSVPFSVTTFNSHFQTVVSSSSTSPSESMSGGGGSVGGGGGGGGGGGW